MNPSKLRRAHIVCALTMVVPLAGTHAADELPCVDVIWETGSGGWNKVTSDYLKTTCVDVGPGSQCTTMKYAKYQSVDTGIVREYNCSLDEWES